MAITMWDHLIPGLSLLRATRYPAMDMTYFVFHRQLESDHERAMEKAIGAIDGAMGASHAPMSDTEKDDFRLGVHAVLDYLEGFWMGLERRPAAAAQARPQPVQGWGNELRS